MKAPVMFLGCLQDTTRLGTAFTNSNPGAPVLKKETEEVPIPIKAGQHPPWDFFCSSLAHAGRGGAEPPALTSVSGTGFPKPPRLLICLMPEVTLGGSHTATDRCGINGLVCTACCSLKCLLITLPSWGTQPPAFGTDPRDQSHCSPPGPRSGLAILGKYFPALEVGWKKKQNMHIHKKKEKKKRRCLFLFKLTWNMLNWFIVCRGI